MIKEKQSFSFRRSNVPSPNCLIRCVFAKICLISLTPWGDQSLNYGKYWLTGKWTPLQVEGWRVSVTKQHYLQSPEQAGIPHLFPVDCLCAERLSLTRTVARMRHLLFSQLLTNWRNGFDLGGDVFPEVRSLSVQVRAQLMPETSALLLPESKPFYVVLKLLVQVMWFSETKTRLLALREFSSWWKRFHNSHRTKWNLGAFTVLSWSFG